jgi:hypothetical protein
MQGKGWILGEVLRQHLAEGGVPDLPEWAGLPWRWFADLNATRTWHAAGPNPISYSEVAAYSALTRQSLRPTDIEVIRAMDRAYIAHFDATGGRSKQVSKTKINAGLFDAVFG